MAYLGPLNQLQVKKEGTEHIHFHMSLLLGFWILSIVRDSINKKTQRFGKRICLRE
jgi:hypothetical protein